MNEWVHVLQQDKQLCSLVRERLDLLNRELLGMMLEIESVGEKKASVKERFLKVNAAIAALKVVQEQIKLGQNLGLIERKPEEVITYGSIRCPLPRCHLRGVALRLPRLSLRKFAKLEEADEDATCES